MKDFFDRYTFSARFLPAALVMLPAGLGVAAWFPAQFEGWGLLTSLAGTAGAAMLLAQIGRDLGKAKEPALFAKWGGKPTLVMLRHRTSTLDPHTLARYHRKLGDLVTGMAVPTAASEKSDPTTTDETYTSWINFLRAATRDRAKFGLLFSENVNYGFRRNLWGMKAAAIFIAIAGIIAAVAKIGWAIWDNAAIPPIAGTVLIVNVLLLVLWLLRFTPSWVHVAANEYARQLLAACDILEAPARPKSAIVLP